MGKSGTKRRRTAAEWEALLTRLEHSGLSQLAFCRREKVSPSALSRWKKRLRGAPDGRPASGFVELTSTLTSEDAGEVATRAWGELELELPGGVRLRWRR